MHFLQTLATISYLSSSWDIEMPGDPSCGTWSTSHGLDHSSLVQRIVLPSFPSNPSWIPFYHHISSSSQWGLGFDSLPLWLT